MLVMEYMDYGSLHDLLKNNTIAIDGEIILPILRDISQGVRFLHSADPQVIHGGTQFWSRFVNYVEIRSLNRTCPMKMRRLEGGKHTGGQSLSGEGSRLWSVAKEEVAGYWDTILDGS